MAILREDSLFFSGFDKANCHIVSCHMERVIHQEEEENSPPSTKKKQETATLSLSAYKKSNAANNHVD